MGCLQKHWSVGKLAWCCQHENKGCPTTSAPVVFDCSAGFNNWQAGWSASKKLFCCTREGRGCDPTTAMPVVTTSCPYDCSAGLPNWHIGWSASKKAWCCQHKGIGCPSTSKYCPYDCIAGLSNWEKGWSAGKKAYCCQHEQVGCAPGAIAVAQKFDEDIPELQQVAPTQRRWASGPAVLGLFLVAGLSVSYMSLSGRAMRGADSGYSAVSTIDRTAA